MEGKPRIDLLLIGKTANGKSATGNSILRKNVFTSSGNTTSVTRKIDYDVAKFDGRVIKVVDAPGVCDNSVDESEAVNFVLKSLQDAMAMNPEGYHAILLVMKYGNRFTREEQRTIKLLKNAFGENFVRNYCILVMSCGDNFKEDVKSDGISFKDWCKKEKGPFQELLNECGGRIVLFDNITKDSYEKRKQLSKLVHKVDMLPTKGIRYTDENFQMARERREIFLQEANESFIRQHTLDETGLIIGDFGRLQQSPKNNNKKIKSLSKLWDRDDKLGQSIKEYDGNCRRFQDLVETVDSLKSIISEELILTNKKKEDEEKWQQTKAVIKQQEDDLALMRLETAKIKEENKRLKEEKEQLRRQRELEIVKKENEEKEKKMIQEIKDKEERLQKITEDLDKIYTEIKTEEIVTLVEQMFSKIGVPLWNYAKSRWSGK